jgi:hypothetical protein
MKADVVDFEKINRQTVIMRSGLGTRRNAVARGRCRLEENGTKGAQAEMTLKKMAYTRAVSRVTRLALRREENYESNL